MDTLSMGANTVGRLQKFNFPGLTFGNYQIENPVISVPAEGETIEFLKRQSPTGTGCGLGAGGGTMQAGPDPQYPVVAPEGVILLI